MVGADLLLYSEQLTAKSRDISTEAVSGAAHALWTRGVVPDTDNTPTILQIGPTHCLFYKKQSFYLRLKCS